MIRPDGGTADKYVSIIFVAEAAFSASITAMTPIVSQLHNNACKIRVVFLGDNKQMNYTPRSEVGQARVGCDILTRLLEDPHYTKGSGVHIQLKNNYRNPTLAVKVMNSLLYNNKINYANCVPKNFCFLRHFRLRLQIDRYWVVNCPGCVMPKTLKITLSCGRSP